MVLHVHGFIIEHHPGDNQVAPQPGKIFKQEISLNRPLLEDHHISSYRITRPILAVRCLTISNFSRFIFPPIT